MPELRNVLKIVLSVALGFQLNFVNLPFHKALYLLELWPNFVALMKNLCDRYRKSAGIYQ